MQWKPHRPIPARHENSLRAMERYTVEYLVPYLRTFIIIRFCLLVNMLHRFDGVIR